MNTEAVSNVFGLTGHTMQLMSIMTILGDFMRNDQVVLSINSYLHVVTDHAAPTPTRGHGSGVGVGQ